MVPCSVPFHQLTDTLEIFSPVTFFFFPLSPSHTNINSPDRSSPPPLLDVIICLKLFICLSPGARGGSGVGWGGGALGFFQSSCEPDSYRQPCYWFPGRRRAMASVWAAISSPVTRHLRSRCFHMHWRCIWKRHPPPFPARSARLTGVSVVQRSRNRKSLGQVGSRLNY